MGNTIGFPGRNPFSLLIVIVSSIIYERNQANQIGQLVGLIGQIISMCANESVPMSVNTGKAATIAAALILTLIFIHTRNRCSLLP